MPRRYSAARLAAAVLALASPAAAAAAPEAVIEAWLRARLSIPAPQPLYYRIAWTDLDGDRSLEAIALLQSRQFCGSSGCSMYVLRLSGAHVTLLGRHTVTRAPVAVLDTRTKGHRDLSVRVSGGGFATSRARLRFDGAAYWSNPSTAPRVPKDAREETLIPAEPPT